MSTEKGSSLRRIREGLDLIAVIGLISASAVMIWLHWPRGGGSGPPVPRDPVPLVGAGVEGAQSAVLAVIEYSDFECPYCGKFARESFDALKDRYKESGAVLWAYKHLPLDKIHKRAFRAAEAAECGRRQGKFWQIHDRLFADQSKLDDASLAQLPNIINLDAAAFSECMKGQATPQIREHASEASALGLTGTPAFLIGELTADGLVRVRTVLTGAVSAAAFAKVIDGILSPSGYGAPLILAIGLLGLVIAIVILVLRRRRSRILGVESQLV